MKTRTYHKKSLTPEQQAVKDVQKDVMQHICVTLSKMSAKEREAMASSIPRVLTCEGRELSIYNQCMLIMQKPDVTIVGGFRQWLQHGRCVTKGEHGLAIWIPLGTPNLDTKEVQVDVEGRDSLLFMLATVFDVSQTHTLEEPNTE